MNKTFEGQAYMFGNFDARILILLGSAKSTVSTSVETHKDSLDAAVLVAEQVAVSAAAPVKPAI